MQGYETAQLRTPAERRHNDERQATGNDPLYGKTLFLVAASLGVLAIYVIAVLLLHFLLVSPHLSDCKALNGLSMPASERNPVTVEVVRGNDKVTNRGFYIQQGSQMPDD